MGESPAPETPESVPSDGTPAGPEPASPAGPEPASPAGPDPASPAGPDPAAPARPTPPATRWVPTPPPPPNPTAAGAALRLGLGLAVAALFWLLGWRVLAAVVGGLALLIGGASLASPRVRHTLDAGFARFGRGLGQVLGALLLTPLFFLGFTTARLLNRLSGHDPLQLRGAEGEISFWQPCDDDARKRRRPRALFATERPRAGGRAWPTLVFALLAVFVLAEGTLRLAGFGDPVLYLNDPTVGYSLAPGQVRTRLGKRIEINMFGMRGPEVEASPAPGALRILMLGDSTLYGGVYVDQDDLYARRLEGLLRAEGGPTATGLEVLALGVNGWGPYHELAFVERYGTFGAQVAVITLPYADIFRPLTPLSATPYLPLESPPRLALTEVLYHLSWRWRTGLVGPPLPSLRDRQGELGIETYLALARTLRARGLEVVVQILPSKQAGTGAGRTEAEARWVPRIEAAFAALGVPVAMPDNLFVDTATRGPEETPAGPMYKDFVHLDTAGHAVYARHLARSLPSQSPRLAAALVRRPQPFPGLVDPGLLGPGLVDPGLLGPGQAPAGQAPAGTPPAPADEVRP